MRAEEKIQFAGKMLDLVRELEELVIEYCRILTSDDDGHCLERRSKDEIPF